MIDSLISTPAIRMLEQTMNFTEQRHQLLLEDIANASTPGFVQQDLSVEEFQGALQDAVERQRRSATDRYEPESGDSIEFEPGGSRILTQGVKAKATAFHDRGVRSMEYLMGNLADNALAHNMAAQFLKGRYDNLARAISMKV